MSLHRVIFYTLFYKFLRYINIPENFSFNKDDTIHLVYRANNPL